MPLPESYSAMIYCYIRGGDVKNAIILAQVFLFHNFFFFSAYSIIFTKEKMNHGYPLGRPVFKALGDLFSSSIENLDTAYYVLEDLFKQDLPLNRDLFDAILFACSQSGETDRAFATFNEYQSFNLTPTLETYNYLLAVCFFFSKFF